MNTRHTLIAATLFVLTFVILLADAALGMETAVFFRGEATAVDPSGRAAALSCTTARIMPVGDSMTAGVGSSHWGGYRLSLFHLLRNEGIPFDFVGTQITGTIPGFDPNHEGYPGERTSAILSRSANMLTTNEPDVILLHIGTNDMNTIKADFTQGEIDDVVNTAVANVSQILDNVDAYETTNGVTVKVIVARIINQACDIGNSKCAVRVPATTQYNAALQTMIDARGDADISVVDMETGAGLVYELEPDGDFTTDEIHPNDSGYNKMGTVWATAVTNLVSGGCDAAPFIYTTPMTTATVGQPFSDNVGASGYPAPTYSLTTAPSGMSINETTGAMSWTPEMGNVGENTVVVVATNSSGTDSQTYTITVAVDPVPMITSTPITQTAANANYSYQVTASGAGPLTYSLTTVPPGMSIDNGTGLITWYADEAYAGPHNVTVEVNNSSGSDTQSFTLFVNLAPMINSNQSNANVTVDDTFNYQVTANGYPTVTFGLTEKPDGMSINATTGAVSWTPALGDLGPHDVTVTAVNSVGSDSQTFTLTAVSAPVISSTPMTKTAVSEPYSYTVTANGTTPFTFSLMEKPDGMTINPGSGVISWTPALAQQGTHTVTVQVENAHGSDMQTFELLVTTAPVIVSQPVTQTNALAAYSYPVIANGTGPFTYTLITKPTGMLVDAAGEISWSPGLADVGAHSVTVEVGNSNGTDRQSYELTVFGAPEITSSPVTETAVSTPYVYAITAGGAAPMSYSLVAGPAGMQVNPTTGLLTWTPSPAQLGEHAVTVQASNAINSDTQSFTLTVVAAPTITSTPVTSVKIGASYSYQVIAAGYPTPTYSLTTAPAGMSIHPTTGLISWTPGVDTVGDTVSVMIAAANAVGSSTQAFSVTVRGDDYFVFLPMIVRDK